MRHVEKAHLEMAKTNKATEFISIENAIDTKGVSPVVKFIIQSDPVSEVGVNGCQATDILEYVKNLFVSLNKAIPNKETVSTIAHINMAIEKQHERTRDRVNRSVEGEQTN